MIEYITLPDRCIIKIEAQQYDQIDRALNQIETGEDVERLIGYLREEGATVERFPPKGERLTERLK